MCFACFDLFLNKFKFSMKNETKKWQKKVQIIHVGGGDEEEDRRKRWRRKKGVTFWIPQEETKSSRWERRRIRWGWRERGEEEEAAIFMSDRCWIWLLNQQELAWLECEISQPNLHQLLTEIPSKKYLNNLTFRRKMRRKRVRNQDVCEAAWVQTSN